MALPRYQCTIALPGSLYDQVEALVAESATSRAHVIMSALKIGLGQLDPVVLSDSQPTRGRPRKLG